MAKSVTPLESFTHLTDHIPSWLTKLDDLTAQVAEQNARFIRLSQHSELLKKNKHNSTESLRPDDDNVGENDTTPVHTDTYLPPNPSHKCPFHASRAKAVASNALVAAEIRRKRKPGSALSNASGHARYRTKSMVIVYYDSAIQESFESLVRSIAGARSILRKGKTSASFKARMVSLGTDDNPFSGAASYKMMGPKMMRPGFSIPSTRLGADYPNGDKGLCFEDADKDLETAQSLCEVAAHQFLRDGDCRLEIEGTRKKFQNCLEVAMKEAERLRDEDAQQRATDIAAEAEETYDEEKPVEVPVVVDHVEEQAAHQVEPPPLKQINLASTGTIEIDDGAESDSIHIDLSAIRRTRRL